MGSSVKTAFHFRLASIGFPSASESLERKNGEGPRQEGCQDPDKKGSKKESSKEAKGKEASISKEGQKASSKEGKEASTKKVKKPKKAKKPVPKKVKKPKRKKGQKKDKNAPKRAMSAFFLFAQDERPKVKAANPSASIGDIGKELGARWAKCPAAAKAGYEKKAGALKVKQQAEMAKYKAAKAKAAGPKRALSAFFIFAADERPKVVNANPSASIGEIGKELGARWAKA